jgi:FtsP/CotA-like multicopper oxidase with cupredoxin domain
MTPDVSKRSLLKTAALAAGAGLVAVLPPASRRAVAAEPLVLRVERRTLEVKGKAASVYGLTQPNGTSGVFLDPDQRFLVNLVNGLDEPTIVHWHGQAPPANQDGVAMTGLEQAIAAGATQPYDFAARAGTHWMHSHEGLQEMQLLAAPLIVRTAADLRMDAQEVIVILHDFTFRSPAQVMAGLAAMSGMQMGGAGKTDTAMGGMEMSGGGMAGMKMGDGQAGGMAGMKMGDGQASGMAGMKMGGAGKTDTAMGGMEMSGGGMAGMKMGDGQAGGMAGMKMGDGDQSSDAAAGEDLNDIDFDAYLANDRTLDDPQVVRVERAGRVRLRLINAASATPFWIDLGTLVGTVLAVDGMPVQPVQGRMFPMSEAQRLDILVDVPAGQACPILAQRVGDTQRTGIILAPPGAYVGRVADRAGQTLGGLDSSLELRLTATTQLPARPVDRRHSVVLTGGMSPYQWYINGQNWGNHTPLKVRRNERIVLDIVNKTSMSHPMHLHGHSFQVIAINDKPIAGAMRDTIQVLPWQSATVAFDADNPGRWLFHCHILAHMETGMITEVAYET